MKLKQGAKVTKGMVFAGCSFTWGQGLYYYSGMDTLQEPPPNHYKRELVNLAHERYMESVRFPRLVANHFNTFELCQPFNGGASYSIHEWWTHSFMDRDNPVKHKANFDYTIPYYDYSEVSHVFYQFTQWHRAQSNYRPDGHPIRHDEAWSNPGFSAWLQQQNMTIEDYISWAKKKEIEDVKNFLQTFEDNGIRVYVMSWPGDIISEILNDSWLSSRFINFTYKGRIYNSMEEMMIETYEGTGIPVNPSLTIMTDKNNFDEPPHDHHPSLTFHRVIADNIIKHLEKEQQ